MTKNGRHFDKNFELLVAEEKNFFPSISIDFDEMLYSKVNRVKLDYRKQHSRMELPALHLGIEDINFDPQEPQDFF